MAPLPFGVSAVRQEAEFSDGSDKWDIIYVLLFLFDLVYAIFVLLALPYFLFNTINTSKFPWCYSQYEDAPLLWKRNRKLQKVSLLRPVGS